MSRGRPRKSKTDNNKKKSSSAPKRKTCLICGPEKGDIPINNFFTSYNKIHVDRRVPICKQCIVNLCFDEETQDINYEEFKNLLRQIDKPYVSYLIQSSINEYNDVYGGKTVPSNNRSKIINFYFKNVNSLPQYKDMDWNDGVEVEKAYEKQQALKDASCMLETGFVFDNQSPNSESDDDIVCNTAGEDEFQVTPDIVRLFGEGYKKHIYKAMWDKYNFLKQSYPDVTNLHTEALVTYVRFKVQEEIATAQGDASAAKTWSEAAMKAAEKAKINPNQLSQSDLQGGLNSFAELLQAVEKAVDVIPILPRFKYRPNDAIDFNIWCFVNYIRDLEGKPLCEYKDVYAFYDKRKEEYISQHGDPYGIFTDDPTESNRAAIEKFIDIPDSPDIIEAGDTNE